MWQAKADETKVETAEEEGRGVTAGGKERKKGEAELRERERGRETDRERERERKRDARLHETTPTRLTARGPGSH